MSILLDRSNRVLVQGVTGQMGTFFVEDARKYGTNMVAGVSPGRAGTVVGDVPVFASVRAAVDATRADTAMVFVPPAAVLGAALEALECGCRLVVATADEMPVREHRGEGGCVACAGERIVEACDESGEGFRAGTVHVVRVVALPKLARHRAALGFRRIRAACRREIRDLVHGPLLDGRAVVPRDHRRGGLTRADER